MDFFFDGVPLFRVGPVGEETVEEFEEHLTEDADLLDAVLKPGGCVEDLFRLR